MISLTGSKM